jgi:TP901 family phage tail tape measure protein
MGDQVQNIIYDLKFRDKTGNSADKVAKDLDAIEDKYGKAEKGSLEYAEATKKAAAANGQLGKSIEKDGKKLGNFGDTIKKARNSLLALAGAGAVFSIFRNGIRTIIDFEQSLASLSSITGATGGDLEFYSEQAREIGRTTTTSASQAVEAFKLIGSAKPELLQSKEALAEVTQQAVILAEASGLELPQAAEALAGSLNQFALEGGPGEQAARVINALAAGSKFGAAAIPEISQAIEKSGTVMDAANVSFEQGIALVETLAEKNIKGAEAGTQLRNILLKLESAGIGVTDGVFNVSEALEELASKNLSAAEASKLFGLESVVAGNILIENQARFAQLTNDVTGTTVAIDQQKTNTETLGATLTKLGNQWDDVVLSFKGGTGALSAAIGFVGRNLKVLLGILVSIVAPFAVYLGIIKGIALAQRIAAASTVAYAAVKGGLAKATQFATVAMKGFNTTLRANPIGAIITLLTIAAGAFAAYKIGAQEGAEEQEKFNAEVEKTKGLLSETESIEAQVAAVNALNETQAKALLERISQQKQGYEEQAAAALAAEKQVAPGILIQREILLKQREDLEAKYAERATFALKRSLRINQQLLDENTAANFAKNTVGISSEAAKKTLEELDVYEDVVNARLQRIRNGAGSELVSGSIAELQSSVNEQRKRIVNEYKLGSEEFDAAVSKYKVSAKELREALASLNEKAEDDLEEGSIAFFRKAVSEAQKDVDTMNQNAKGYEDAVDRLIKAEEELEKAKDKIRREDPDKLRKAELKEQERHELAMFDVESSAALKRAEAAGVNEEQRKQLEEDYARKRLEIQIEYAKDYLKLLQETGKSTDLELEKALNKITELEAKLKNSGGSSGGGDGNNTKDYFDEAASAAENLASEVAASASSIIATETAKADALIEIQKQKVADARKLAEEGNAEQLILETDRLERLQKEREKHVARQTALAQAEAAAEAVVAIARAASSSQNGFVAAASIAAVIAALVAGIVAARETVSTGFFSGGVADWSNLGGYTGSGNPREVSTNLGRKPYNYHKKEFVMSAAVTGIGDNLKFFEAIHRGRMDLRDVFNSPGIVVPVGNDSKNLQRIEDAINNLPASRLEVSTNKIAFITERKTARRKALTGRL